MRRSAPAALGAAPPSSPPPSSLLSCYSCYPSRFVRRHVTFETDAFVFSYDMWGRPLFIVTPRHHYHDINEMSGALLVRMFDEVERWLRAHGICDYQTQLHWNRGAWQTHHHFHLKLRVDERRYYAMRKRHFDALDRVRRLAERPWWWRGYATPPPSNHHYSHRYTSASRRRHSAASAGHGR